MDEDDDDEDEDDEELPEASTSSKKKKSERDIELELGDDYILGNYTTENYILLHIFMVIQWGLVIRKVEFRLTRPPVVSISGNLVLFTRPQERASLSGLSGTVEQCKRCCGAARI